MPSLLGRERELRALTTLIDGVPERGDALVVRGEAGIGKSTLLTGASQHARTRGMSVLAAVGVQAEAHLPFAGLHQLLRPVLAGVAALPPPQRAAMQAAFGLTDAAAPDLFLIALAALDLLADAAADAPLLLIVDDAQWLDRPTADALAFVARRLASEPIALLAAVRDGFASPLEMAGLPELRLGGLAPDMAAALLDAHAPDLDAGVRARLLDEAAGNPLALVEMPIALRAEQAIGDMPLPAWLPLTTRLERAFATRATALPEATRALLLVAAADDGGILDEVLTAGPLAGVSVPTAEILDPAVDARLVAIDGGHIRFRHPLMRSAIYQAAAPSRRRAAHAALAVALAGQPDRRIWHRAAATVGTDEAVAAELAVTAARALRRGALSVAATALERAAGLGGDPERRGDWLLTAAGLAFQLGRHDHGARLLQEVEPLDLLPLDRARLAWFRETSAGEAAWSGAANVRPFVAMAEQALAAGDADLALSRLLLIALRCWWSNPDRQTRDLVVATAERLPVAEDHPALIAILAFAAPVERGAAVIERLARAVPGGTTDPGVALLLATAASAVGDDERVTPHLAVAVAGLRAQGQLGRLAQALVTQAWSAFHLGNWHAALPAAEEAIRLARETVQPRWAAAAQLAAASVAAVRGEQETAAALAEEAERVLLSMGAHPMLALVQLARGVAGLAAGHHADAFAHLRRIFDPADIAYHAYLRSWAVADLAEAAMYSGQQEEGLAMVNDLEPLATLTRSPILRAGLRYARALLPGDDADESSNRDSQGADLAARPFLRARLLLAQGARLRRQRRTGAARAPLRAARDTFDALGAVPWGELARQELRASGEASRLRQPGALDRLTPQELQIAQLAAEGLSNREIGQQLYLSHRTISTHLYRIFPKLGITSRAELHSALGIRYGAIA